MIVLYTLIFHDKREKLFAAFSSDYEVAKLHSQRRKANDVFKRPREQVSRQLCIFPRPSNIKSVVKPIVIANSENCSVGGDRVFIWRSRTSDKGVHFRRRVQRVRRKVNNSIWRRRRRATCDEQEKPQRFDVRTRFRLCRRGGVVPTKGTRTNRTNAGVTASPGAEPNLTLATLRKYDSGLAEDRPNGAARMRAADRLAAGTTCEGRTPSIERRSARDRCQRGVASASEQGSMCDKCVIGYWVPERKRQKFNWTDFENICESEGFRLKMVSGRLSPARLDRAMSMRRNVGDAFSWRR